MSNATSQSAIAKRTARETGKSRYEGKPCKQCRLPTSPRQAVRLTDVEALSALPDCHGQSFGKTWLLSAARAIEAAVLAANGMGDGNAE